MWGLDSGGLRTLDSDIEESFRISGAFISSEPTFSMFDLLTRAFPKKPDGDPMSKSHLSKIAKQGGLKWGPLPIEPDELDTIEETNQDFVVLSMGKRNRVMVFFESNANIQTDAAETPYGISCPVCRTPAGALCVESGRWVGQHHERFLAWKDLSNA